MDADVDTLEKNIYYVQKEFEPSTHWTTSLVRTDELDSWVLHELISRFAWKDRENEVTAEYYDSDVSDSLSPLERDLYLTVCNEAEMQRARFDYRYTDLMELAVDGKSSGSQTDLYDVFVAFASLGSRSAESGEYVQKALLNPKMENHGRAILLQGMWMGVHMDNQGSLMLNLSQDMINRGEITDTLYYYRAFALRRLGRYNEALDCIDVAIAMLGVHSVDIHQDYSREKDMIVTSMLLEERFG